jgi:nucleotide-binding universal stress UspA family protein
MLRIKKILCPVDFSEFSAKAYEYASSLARHYRAQLFLEHVVQLLPALYAEYPSQGLVRELQLDLEGNARRQLEEMAKAQSWNGILPNLVVKEGMLPTSVLSFAEKELVDLIVMGTHGRQGLDRLAMGSVTEKILRKARCPVLAVRRPAHDFVSKQEGRDPVQLSKILLATDFSDYSRRSLDYALSLATEYNAELVLLHVLEHVPDRDLMAASARAQRELEESIPADACQRCTVRSTVRIGRPYREIIQLALEAQTDLVVMGVRGRNTLDLAIFGSTTHRVIQLGSCPVLAVRV